MALQWEISRDCVWQLETAQQMIDIPQFYLKSHNQFKILDFHKHAIIIENYHI